MVPLGPIGWMRANTPTSDASMVVGGRIPYHFIVMKLAYLILAHRNPGLLQRLVNRLASSDSAVFIHIDAKTDIEIFKDTKGDNVHYCEDRVNITWGEYTIVDATLRLMQMALNSGTKFDYLILLSGSDYPVKPQRYIHSFFEKNNGAEFISMVTIPNREAGIPLKRIRTLRYPKSDPVRNLFFRFLAKFGLAQRDHRKRMGAAEAYGGSMWWALTAGACRYILESTVANSAVCQYFKHTAAPDEMFFHTILGNSRFRPHVQRNVMYDDWINIAAHSPHPALINEKHIQYFGCSEHIACNDAFGPGEMLFARKFSEDNLELLDQMDEMIASRDRTYDDLRKSGAPR